MASYKGAMNGENSWWSRNGENRVSDGGDQVGDERWYQSVWNKLPQLRRPNMEVNITAATQYSHLNAEQIQYLENDALEKIRARSNTWCWFQDMNALASAGAAGIVSVAGTGSSILPLPLPAYPGDTFPGHQLYVKNSLLLPESPLEIYHREPLRTQISNAFKEHYNFPNEKHLYLRRPEQTGIVDQKVVVISIVGHLPDKYEKITLGKQPSAYYLTQRFLKTLEHVNPGAVVTFSIEADIDTQPMETAFQSLVKVFNNWKFRLKDASAIYIQSVYHSVPIAIKLAKHLMMNHIDYGFTDKTSIGLLGLESCIEGYRFWDHSIDISSSTEQEIEKLQQAKEKQLYQGCTKQQQTILAQIKEYCDLESEESQNMQNDLDWVLYNWGPARVTLVGKLYDNFMTLSQKLAIDYRHSKIMRSLWCNGSYLGLDPKLPEKISVPNSHLKTIKFDCNVQIPEERLFEVSLLMIVVLALNLGYTSGTSLAKLIGPYFISRSYNSNTVPPNIRKQQTYDNKIWLQEMEEKWKDLNIRESYMDELPKHVSSTHSFLEFSYFQAQRSPDLLQIKSDIYDDDSVYKLFLENTMLTRNPRYKKHLQLHKDEYMPSSIFDRANQYDLVWKFHEFLSNFVTARNLPRQNFPPLISFSISLDYSFWKYMYPESNSFNRDTTESRKKLVQLWECYNSWDPPTRGLQKLRNILSVLSIYKEPSKFIEDIQRTL